MFTKIGKVICFFDQNSEILEILLSSAFFRREFLKITSPELHQFFYCEKQTTLRILFGISSAKQPISTSQTNVKGDVCK